LQEFVNKQLPGWIQEGVTSGLRNLPPSPPALTLEQIRVVIRAENSQSNPDAERIAREREYQKEKETFEQWRKEQIQQAEENLAKKMEKQAAH
jgi:hypothetical protein